jgi:hypothetical protein
MESGKDRETVFFEEITEKHEVGKCVETGCAKIRCWVDFKGIHTALTRPMIAAWAKSMVLSFS